MTKPNPEPWPGPYTATHDFSGLIHITAAGDRHITSLAKHSTPGFDGQPSHADRQAATAELFAAAPDMLAALKHLLGGAVSLPRFAEIEVRAAIAKAEGR